VYAFSECKFDVLKIEQTVQKYCSISKFQVNISMEATVRKDVVAITNALKKRGCSRKAIEEILRFYGFSKKKATQKRPVK